MGMSSTIKVALELHQLGHFKNFSSVIDMGSQELHIDFEKFKYWVEQTNLQFNEEQFNNEFNLATTALPGTDFDEDWEKTLFKICYPNPRYKAKAVEISRFFSYIKDDLLKGYKNEQLKELTIEKTLGINGGDSYLPKGGDPDFDPRTK